MGFCAPTYSLDSCFLPSLLSSEEYLQSLQTSPNGSLGTDFSILVQTVFDPYYCFTKSRFATSPGVLRGIFKLRGGLIGNTGNDGKHMETTIIMGTPKKEVASKYAYRMVCRVQCLSDDWF